MCQLNLPGGLLGMESSEGSDRRHTLKAMTGLVYRQRLDLIVHFHREMDGLIQSQELPPDHKAAERVRRALERYRAHHNRNTLLQMISHLEWMLALSSRRPEVKQGPGSLRDGLLKRYKLVLDSIGVQVGKLNGWPVLCDAVTVRHCLLHANGQVRFMEDPSEVEDCTVRHPEGLSLERGFLRVEPPFLEAVLEAIRELQQKVLGGLGEVIDDWSES